MSVPQPGRKALSVYQVSSTLYVMRVTSTKCDCMRATYNLIHRMKDKYSISFYSTGYSGSSSGDEAA